jgi:hypothetical protein
MDSSIESWKRQLEIRRKNLNRLEEQAAGYGSLDVPLWLQNKIELEEREIARLEGKLRSPDAIKELEALYQQGVQAMLNGQWATAIKYLEQVIARDPLYKNAAELLEETKLRLQQEKELRVKVRVAYIGRIGAVIMAVMVLVGVLGFPTITEFANSLFAPTPTSVAITNTITPTPTVTSTPTAVPTPTPTSVLDVFAKTSRFLTIEDLKYVGTYQSEGFVSMYSSEDWATCPSETLSLDSIAGVAVRGEWTVSECGDRFETRVREEVTVLQNTQETEHLFKTLVAEAKRVPWFHTAYEFATEYGSFWVVRSDYQNGTTATMIAEVDGGVIQLFIDSNAAIDEMNLNALILSAILRLRQYPLSRGVPILLDTSLFSEKEGRSLAIYPIPQTRRVYDLQPTISEIMQKYGEADRIIETKLIYGLDALDNPIKLGAKVYYYGDYGFSILVDQVIDQETLDYIRDTYGWESYETLINPKNGEVIWVVVD